MDKKKLIISIGLLAVLWSCKKQPFRGFLVCKEYTHGHMDDTEPIVVQEATFVPVRSVIVPHRHVPQYVPSSWIFYVANKDGVRRFDVDSLTYTRHKVGERIVMDFK